MLGNKDVWAIALSYFCFGYTAHNFLHLVLYLPQRGFAA